MIKRLILICFIYFCLINTAFAIETGLYLSPKFLFSISPSNIKTDNKTVNNLYIGAGASIGYNFYAINLYSPVRIEFEYLYRGGLNRNIYSDSASTNDIISMHNHTFLLGAYYDFNFFRVNYNPVAESRVYRNGKRYLMNIYLGLLLGAGLEQYITQTITERIGMINIANYYNKTKFIYGFAFGFAVNITTLIAVDIGYRFLLDTEIKMKHDIIAALRLNF